MPSHQLGTLTEEKEMSFHYYVFFLRDVIWSFPFTWGLSFPSSLLQHLIFLTAYTFPLLREDTSDVISVC